MVCPSAPKAAASADPRGGLGAEPADALGDLGRERDCRRAVPASGRVWPLSLVGRSLTGIHLALHLSNASQSVPVEPVRLGARMDLRCANTDLEPGRGQPKTEALLLEVTCWVDFGPHGLAAAGPLVGLPGPCGVLLSGGRASGLQSRCFALGWRRRHEPVARAVERADRGCLGLSPGDVKSPPTTPLSGSCATRPRTLTPGR